MGVEGYIFEVSIKLTNEKESVVFVEETEYQSMLLRFDVKLIESTNAGREKIAIPCLCEKYIVFKKNNEISCGKCPFGGHCAGMLVRFLINEGIINHPDELILQLDPGGIHWPAKYHDKAVRVLNAVRDYLLQNTSFKRIGYKEPI